MCDPVATQSVSKWYPHKPPSTSFFFKSEQSPCPGGPQNTLSTFHQSEHKPLHKSNSLSNPSGLIPAGSSLFAGWFDERGLKKINLIPIAALSSKKKKRQVIPNTVDCNRQLSKTFSLDLSKARPPTYTHWSSPIWQKVLQHAHRQRSKRSLNFENYCSSLTWHWKKH